jgi:hypothetical protein
MKTIKVNRLKVELSVDRSFCESGAIVVATDPMNSVAVHLTRAQTVALALELLRTIEGMRDDEQ